MADQNQIIYSGIKSTFNLDQALDQHFNHQNLKNLNRENLKFSRKFRQDNLIHESSFERDLLKQHISVFKHYLPYFLHFDNPNILEDEEQAQYGLPIHLSKQVNRAKSDQVYPQSVKMKVYQQNLKMQYYGNKNSITKFKHEMKSIVKSSILSYLYEIIDDISVYLDRLQDKLYQIDKIIQYSQYFVNNIKIQKKIFLDIQCSKKQKYEWALFLRVYCTTIALVIAEYFQNPYYQGSYAQDGHSRIKQSEDSYQEFHKIRHLNTNQSTN